ncbi:MAG: hypothetical protein ABI881_11490 [Betaproteobacteria bacterium]
MAVFTSGDEVACSATALTFNPEFDGFLMATIGGDSNNSGMQLSVLSALARLDVDPWQEAAELSRLPSETAIRKLTSLIAALPNGPSTRLDAGTIAARLIPLLPRRAVSDVQPRARLSDADADADADAAGHAARVKLVIIYVFWIGVMLVTQWFATNPAEVAQSDKQAPSTTTVSSQTPPQNSSQ